MSADERRFPCIGTYPLEDIAVPTLVIAAEDDSPAPYADGRAMSGRIHGSVLVTVPRGGHALTHPDPAATAAISHFLDDGREGCPTLAGEPTICRVQFRPRP